MSTRVAFPRNLVVVSSLLAVAGCAATTPSPRFTAVSPADPAGPESTVPPPAARLTGGGELAEKEEAEASADAAPPATSPAGAMSGQPGPEQQGMAKVTAVFTCPMHPEVTAKEPGQCPICGMTLVKKAAAPKERP